MRTRKIKRVVDAKDTQGRVIIWLVDCTHKISFTVAELAQLPPNYLADLVQVYGTIECPFCDDPPPEVRRQETSARQLWKDAGEP